MLKTCRNVKWYSLYGKQCGGSSNNKSRTTIGSKILICECLTQISEMKIVKGGKFTNGQLLLNNWLKSIEPPWLCQQLRFASTKPRADPLDRQAGKKQLKTCLCTPTEITFLRQFIRLAAIETISTLERAINQQDYQGRCSYGQEPPDQG